MLPAGLAPVHRQALLPFVVPMAASYLRHFKRPGWRFLGSEVIVGDVALDLLWQRGSRLEADEVKSSASTPTLWRAAAEAQLDPGFGRTPQRTHARTPGSWFGSCASSPPGRSRWHASRIPSAKPRRLVAGHAAKVHEGLLAATQHLRFSQFLADTPSYLARVRSERP
jgi:hypothetical protein